MANGGDRHDSDLLPPGSYGPPNPGGGGHGDYYMLRRIERLESQVRDIGLLVSSGSSVPGDVEEIKRKIDALREGLSQLRIDVKNNQTIVAGIKYLSAAVVSTAIAVLVTALITKTTGGGG